MKKEKPYKFRQVPSVTPADIWPLSSTTGRPIPPERKSAIHAAAIQRDGHAMDMANMKYEKRK